MYGTTIPIFIILINFNLRKKRNKNSPYHPWRNVRPTPQHGFFSKIWQARSSMLPATVWLPIYYCNPSFLEKWCLMCTPPKRLRCKARNRCSREKVSALPSIDDAGGAFRHFGDSYGRTGSLVLFGLQPEFKYIVPLHKQNDFDSWEMIVLVLLGYPFLRKACTYSV